jgi:uncharacterized protein (DUF1800 family)
MSHADKEKKAMQAALAAHNASRAAVVDPKAHDKAARAHEKAAIANSDIGHHTVAQMHSDAAVTHRVAKATSQQKKEQKP